MLNHATSKYLDNIEDVIDRLLEGFIGPPTPEGVEGVGRADLPLKLLITLEPTLYIANSLFFTRT